VVNGRVNQVLAKQALGNGIGTFAFLDDFMGKAGTPETSVANRNALQKWVIQSTRLGIPIMFHGEALHGVVTSGATSFPQAIALGSTWDPPLLRAMFGAVASEARAVGDSLVLAPVLDLSRDPRFGRVEEMYSEDPYLVGQLGVAAILGLQGDSEAIDQQHVAAAAKHFIHGQPENGTNVGPNDFSERTMREIFLYPFQQAVENAHLGAVMPSYNENSGGIPSSANLWLLKQILRQEWKFSGVTVSDYGAVEELASTHHVAANVREAGLLAFSSGVDMELPSPSGFPFLADAVRLGKVPQPELDAAVARVLRLKFRLGLFEQPYTNADLAKGLVGSAERARLARKIADEAIILLKNHGSLLPLHAERLNTIAVIGPNADKARLGTYSGIPPHFVTVLDGIRKRAGPHVKVVYAEGVRISEPDMSAASNTFAPYQSADETNDKKLIQQATDAARSSDVVVLVLGDNETLSRESFGDTGGFFSTSFGDSDTLELPGRQNELTEAIAKLGKPVVAVLLNGRPFAINQLAQEVPTILEGWYLGQETGTAIADVLFGDINPSGHLPVSIARSVGQLPVFYYKTPAARRGYVLAENTPLFPFGFGLTYTTFSYGKPDLDRPQISPGETAKVSISISNTGARAGDDVVQFYIRHEVSSVVQPDQVLRGFQRIHLEAGESRTVSFDVGAKELGILNAQMHRVVEPGAVDVLLGPNSAETSAVQLVVAP